MKYQVVSDFNNIHVLLKVYPYYTMVGRKFPVHKIKKFANKLKIKFPFYLVGTADKPNDEFTDVFMQFDYTINNQILKEFEYIMAYVNSQCDEEKIDKPAGFDFTIISIKSEADEDFKEAKEWIPMSNVA